MVSDEVGAGVVTFQSIAARTTREPVAVVVTPKLFVVVVFVVVAVAAVDWSDAHPVHTSTHIPEPPRPSTVHRIDPETVMPA